MKKFLSLQILIPVLLIAIVIGFFTMVSELDRASSDEALLQLEESIRRAAVACYAAEGIYPPDTDYLAKHYGIQIDENLYQVHYDIFASNIMPDITVLKKE
ncbi:MAG: hypothetical protein IJN72_08665 [Firmicutes bacterium]|nr:hypothetical protein [Bacillota bacterium]